MKLILEYSNYGMPHIYCIHYESARKCLSDFKKEYKKAFKQIQDGENLRNKTFIFANQQFSVSDFHDTGVHFWPSVYDLEKWFEFKNKNSVCFLLPSTE